MRLGVRTLMLLLVCTAVVAADRQDRRRTEADLKAVAAQIEKVRNQVQRDAVEKDRLSRDLRAAEESVAAARDELNRLRDQRGARAAERARIAAERATRQAALAQARESLAAQLRAAYLLGRDEPLKLLLNQKDPAQAGRNVAYYGYFGRMRATQIGAIQDNLREIDELQIKLDAEDAELARLEAARKAQLDTLEGARRARGKVLATLTAESRNRSQSLERLQRQQTQLDKLLKDLNRALESYPMDGNDAFAKLRGQLAWPVDGRLSARYGETRAGGVKWNGVVIATERGAPVKAVSHGRVAYADWLPGLGLLLIIDHGNGYWSLYGYNERLYKAAGSTVRAGETVAGAGDSGGRSQNELYFEIRRAGKPVDPRPWFRSGTPPPG